MESCRAYYPETIDDMIASRLSLSPLQTYQGAVILHLLMLRETGAAVASHSP